MSSEVNCCQPKLALSWFDNQSVRTDTLKEGPQVWCSVVEVHATNISSWLGKKKQNQVTQNRVHNALEQLGGIPVEELCP